MNKATFNSITLEDIHGRMMCCLWRQNLGFARYAIELRQHVWSANMLDTAAFPDDVPGRWSSDLTISEGDLAECTFPSIDFKSIHARVSQREKVRRSRFEYDRLTINGAAFTAPTFGFTAQPAPAAGPLKDTYQFKLDGELENIVEFEAVMTDVASVVARWVTIRTGEENSWLKKITDTHVAANVTRGLFGEYTIGFTKQDITINPTTLDQIEVLELSGLCLADPLPEVTGYTLDVGRDSLFGGRVTGVDLLNHRRNQRTDDLTFGETLEIATVVFKPGHYRALVVD